MALYRYRKVTDAFTTKLVDEGQEIATINGETYVLKPDAISAEKATALSVSEAVVDEKLKADLLAHSPHIQLLRQRVEKDEKVRLPENDVADMTVLADFLPLAEKGKALDWIARNAIVREEPKEEAEAVVK